MQDLAVRTIPSAQANQPTRLEIDDGAFDEHRRSGGAANLPHGIGRDDATCRFPRENSQVPAALEFGEFAQVPLDPDLKNVTRWHAAFKQRPSASA